MISVQLHQTKQDQNNINTYKWASRELKRQWRAREVWKTTLEREWQTRSIIRRWLGNKAVLKYMPRLMKHWQQVCTLEGRPSFATCWRHTEEQNHDAEKECFWDLPISSLSFLLSCLSPCKYLGFFFFSLMFSFHFFFIISDLLFPCLCKCFLLMSCFSCFF